VPKPPKSLHDRIEALSIPVTVTGCWLWTGKLDARGYGQMQIAGADQARLALGRTQLAHRVSWLVYRGAIPAGMCVLHACDVPACVNPDHLWLGTLSDNNRDCLSKGRHPLTGRRTPDQIGATYIARDGAWQAQRSVDGHNHYLGRFASRDAAAAAYRAFGG
jgi:hypothetical protein